MDTVDYSQVFGYNKQHLADRCSGMGMLLKKAQRFMEPEVYVDDGTQGVFKDYSRYQRTIWRFLAQYLVGREKRIMTRLVGVVPALQEAPNKWMVRMEYIPADKTIPLDFGVQLDQAVRHMHAHGIVHNDLHRSNILVSQGRVILIDFTGALHCPSWMAPAMGFLFRRDLAHVAKIKNRMGLGITPEEQQRLNKPRWVQLIQSSWALIYGGRP